MSGTLIRKLGNLLLSLALLLGLTLPVCGQRGNRVLTLTGTSVTGDWSLQSEVVYSLTGNSVLTFQNIPTSSVIKTTYGLMVSASGAETLTFTFPGTHTTNWLSNYLILPHSGQTYYLFEQYGTTVRITADPSFYATTAGQVLRRTGGTNGFGNIDLADSDAVGTTVLPIANGGSGQATANLALNAFLPSQGGNANKFLQTDGSNTSWQTASGGSSSVLAYNGTTISVSNTVTETAIFTNSITAGLLGTNKTVTVTLLGDALNNSGGTSNVTVKVYLGSTVVYNDVIALTTVGQYRGYRGVLTVGGRNSTASQICTTLFNISAAGGPTTGVGRINADGLSRGGAYGFGTEDSTAALPLSITVTLPHAVSTIVWNTYYSVFFSQ